MKIDCNFPWRTQPLSQIITDSVSGVSLGDNDFSDNGFPVAHKGDVRTNGILDLSPRNSRYVSGKSFELNKRAQVTSEFLVVSLRDLVPAAPQLGLINKLPEDQSCVLLAQGTYGFKVDPKQLDMTFLSQLSSADFFRSTMKKNAVGSTQKHLRSTEFFELEVPVPPIDEQEKIAKILSTWDEAIEKLALVITSKQGFKSCILRDVFNIKKLEYGWREVPLIEVADKSTKYSFTGGPFGSNLKASDYTEKGIRIIQLQNIGDGFFNDGYRIYTSAKKADELASCNIYPGDIILSKMGDPVARATLIPSIEERFLMASDGIRLKVDESKFDRDFILEAINSPFFRNKAISASTGSTRQRIGLGDLKTITLTAPKGVDEQRKLGRFFVTINDEIKKLQNTHSLLKLQKQGLMQQLLTGKKRVKV